MLLKKVTKKMDVAAWKKIGCIRPLHFGVMKPAKQLWYGVWMCPQEIEMYTDKKDDEQ